MSLILPFLILALVVFTACRGVQGFKKPEYSGLTYRIESISSDRGARIRYMLIYEGTEPSDRVIFLFPGRDGTCHFGYQDEKDKCGKSSSNSIDISFNLWVSYNFLARNAGRFMEKGHTVVLVDMPEDVKQRILSVPTSAKITGSAYRVGGDWDGDSVEEPDDVVSDISAIVSDLQNTYGITIRDLFLVGTSRGTLAVAYLSHKISGVKGIVLTATVSSDGGNYSSYCPSGASDFLGCTGLNSYAGRILMVHHRKDGCPVSKYRSARELFDNLSSPQKSFTTVSGGSEVSSNPCKARTYHGFWGRDREVVNLILNWIGGMEVPSNL